MTLKSANHRLGKCIAEWLPVFCLYCTALPGVCGLILIWDYQLALMLRFPLRRGPSLSEASVLLVQAPCLRQVVHQLPSLLSVFSSLRWLCTVTQAYIEIQPSSRMQGLLWTTLTWLFWESLRELLCNWAGEILIKILSVIWDDSLWSWGQCGKHFPFFEQAKVDLCLLILSIYSKWLSVHRSFIIYNKFTNSEIWVDFLLNWPACLTVQLGFIS